MKKMLQNILEGKSTVAISGHIRPDGDCVGSCMGLYQYIQNNWPELETDVYLEEIPKPYKFMKVTKDIKHEIPDGKKYDVFFCLDCGDAARLGFSAPLFFGAETTVCIDHHISNIAFAEHNYIEVDASSTSELVFNLMEPEKITKEIAEALYMGIAHDTGIFQYSCCHPSTMEAAAQLLRTGIDASEIIDKTYYEKTYGQNQILGRALLESILLLDKRCIASVVTKNQMEFFGVTPKDLDGIVSQLRNTQGAEVAIFLYELEPQEYKVSLRSKGAVDVSVIAQYFNGGGHVRAAGFSMNGTSHDVINNVCRQIERQFTEEV